MQLMMKHVALACLLLAAVCVTGVLEQVLCTAWDLSMWPSASYSQSPPTALAERHSVSKALTHVSSCFCIYGVLRRILLRGVSCLDKEGSTYEEGPGAAQPQVVMLGVVSEN